MDGFIKFVFKVPKLVYNETCQKTDQCNDVQKTICNKRCQCSDKEYFNGLTCGKSCFPLYIFLYIFKYYNFTHFKS